jgi:hypothetical protein
MNLRRLLPCLLALFLHARAWLPTVRSASPLTRPVWVLLGRWVATVTAVSGGAHALSGASATLAGLVAYRGNTVISPTTNRVQGQVGSPFKARIIVLDPGSDRNTDVFDCRPLPPGLTIDTNAGGKGYIQGTPTRAGTYPVTIFAGNLNYDKGMISMPVVLDIAGNGVPPALVQLPTPQLAAEGGTAEFAVVAGGDAPLTYQWWQGSLPVPAASLARLVLTNLTSAHAGLYRVVVSNLAGSVTSPPVQLTVQPFSTPIRLVRSAYTGDSFVFTIEGPPVGKYILWKSLDAQNWFPIATQQVVSGSWQFGANCTVKEGFFRATATP